MGKSRRLTFSDHIDRSVERGRRVAESAREVRNQHRRRTRPGDGQRQRDISYALMSIDGAMLPIRRLIGKLPHEDTTEGRMSRLLDVSRQLQYERRQLKKMRVPGERGL